MLKLAYFLRKVQTLRVNNSTILTIKKGTFPGYYFYTIISVPLRFYFLKIESIKITAR